MNTQKPTGEIVSPEELRAPYAKSAVNYISHNFTPYIRLIECRATDHLDVLVVEIDVELYQDRLIDIQPTEIIEILFGVDADTLPIFRPLRTDFPIDTLHVMVGIADRRPSLCLWDIPFEELRSRFTPYLMFARLKEWLEQSADGTLHAADQPLEPVLISSGVQIIIPFDAARSQDRYVAIGSAELDGEIALHFVRQSQISEEASLQHVLVAFRTPELTHRAVHYAPTNLEELRLFLEDIDFDIRSALKSWISQVQQESGLLDSIPVILLELPKKRTEDSPVESTEYWGFMVGEKKVRALGEALGAFVDASAYGIEAPAILLNSNEEYQSLEAFEILAVNVNPEIRKDFLASLSGYKFGERFSLVAIGAGAVGSKIIEIAARCGFGEWTVVDKDVFLPHNAVRHVLGNWSIAEHKAESLKEFINCLVPGCPVTKSIVVDIKNPGKRQEVLDHALDAADLILDMSASVAVARQICEHTTNKRRASLFLNPSGRDIVFLLENADRSITLWDLEGAYYRSVASNAFLQGHLNDETAPTRYGNGCRDVTARISADQIATLSGIGLRQLIQHQQFDTGVAAIWRSDLHTGEIKKISVPVAPGITSKIGQWRIRWNLSLIHHLARERKENLPNETGGILLGLVDLEHQMIVVVDSQPAPADSVKRPHFFERGTTGLADTLDIIAKKTVGQLRYLGEWHSHPDGVMAYPSQDDEAVFGHLEACLAGSSEPYLMTIVGQDEIFTRLGYDGDNDETSLALQELHLS